MITPRRIAAVADRVRPEVHKWLLGTILVLAFVVGFIGLGHQVFNDPPSERYPVIPANGRVFDGTITGHEHKRGGPYLLTIQLSDGSGAVGPLMVDQGSFDGCPRGAHYPDCAYGNPLRPSG